jgi:hypothetical protein
MSSTPSWQRHGIGLELSMSNKYFFTNSLTNDVLFRPLFPDQRIHIGVLKGAPSPLTIENDTVTFNNKVKFTDIIMEGSIEFGKCNVNVNGIVNACNLITTKLGVGTTSPIHDMEVHGSAAIDVLYVMSNFGVRTQTPQYPLDVCGAMRVDTGFISCNLGIKTSTPECELDVNGTARISSNAMIKGDLTVSKSMNAPFLYISSNLDVAGVAYVDSIGVNKSNPEFAVDVAGDIQASNIFVIERLGIMTQFPRSQLDVWGEARCFTCLADSIGVLTDNPTFPLDVNGDAIASNIYARGKMGVKTTSPQYELDVAGDIRGSNGYFGDKIGVRTSNPRNAVDVIGTIQTESLLVESNARTPLLYVTNRLGVKTSSPIYDVDVNGVINSTSAYVSTRLGVGTTNPGFTLDVRGTSRTCNSLVTSSLGIGTTAPQGALHVAGDVQASNVRIGASIAVNTSLSDYNIDVNGKGRFNDVHVMGKLGVGHSNPSSSVDIVGNLSVSSNLMFSNRHDFSLSVQDGDFIINNSSNCFFRIRCPGRLDSLIVDTTNGNVGVGGIYPQHQLDVSGVTRMETAICTTNMQISSNVDYTATEMLDVSGGNAIMQSNLYVMTGLAIGHSNPRYNLDVIGNSHFNGSITTTTYIETVGADYGEYMKKTNPTDVFNDGDIVGITSRGLLTMRYSEAVSFAIKSTCPGTIGGAPALTESRKMYEVVAFCGRVPVNITTAVAGEYVVPYEHEHGYIGITAVGKRNMTIEMYLASVGKVINILSDGRAEVLAKIV